MESNEKGTLTADRHIMMAKRNVLDINSMGYIDLENLLFSSMLCRAFCGYLNKSFDPPTGRHVEM